MIKIVEIMKHNHLNGFEITGHAGYAEKGKDIVCCGVSVLSQNAINSLTSIAVCPLDYVCEDGHIRMEVKGQPSIYADVILSCTQLGLRGIAEQYPTYIDYMKGGANDETI